MKHFNKKKSLDFYEYFVRNLDLLDNISLQIEIDILKQQYFSSKTKVSSFNRIILTHLKI